VVEDTPVALPLLQHLQPVCSAAGPSCQKPQETDKPSKENFEK